EAMPQVALVVQEPGERGAVAGLLEELAPARGGAPRLGVAAQVHERVHEPDRTAALLARVAGERVPRGSAPVGGGGLAGAAQGAERVRLLAPECATAGGVQAREGAREHGVEPGERGGGLRSPERFEFGEQRLNHSDLERGQAESLVGVAKL